MGDSLEGFEGCYCAFRQGWLKIKWKKCEFGRKLLEYLGHQVGCGRVAVPEDRVRAMAEFLRPVTKKQLRSFLGRCPIIGNSYRVSPVCPQCLHRLCL